MGFPAYILETLNKYGKVDLGPLGTFNLDYSPAKWHVSREYFEPPHSFLSWSPSVENEEISDYTLGPLTSVISGMHDIPYDQAATYCHQQIELLNQALGEKDLDLNPFGTLTRKKENEVVTFIKNPAFEPILRFDPVHLSKLPKSKKEDTSFKWWLVLVSALFLATLFFLINRLFESNTDLVMSFKEVPGVSYPSHTSLMDANTAPLTSDTLSSHQTIVKDSVPAVATIITGTFCHQVNIDRMKKSIADQGYQLYEEKLDNDCVRLGVLLTVSEDFENTLENIRNNIEPSAWVLPH